MNSTATSVQRRTKWSFSNPFKSRGPSASDRKKASEATSGELDNPKKRQEFINTDFSGVQDNIFQDEIDEATKGSGDDPNTGSAASSMAVKTRENTAMVVNPDPRSRLRWQRKKVIQMVRRGGQLTKEERIKMTERELLHKSAFVPTSVKKLVMLSRQIAGKPVEDAIAQMKWSKKKYGAELAYYLEEARDLAIAQRGMGLGKANNETLPEPRRIQTKDGKWMDIEDPTSMYVDQSWVGRGAWLGKETDFKGRGRSGIIQHAQTSA